MPKTISIETYTYEELSDKAQAKARDWYRECSQGDLFWSEYVIEDATEILKRIGVELDKDGIVWSGFSSQGDGACFAGTYRPAATALQAIKDHAPVDAKLHAIVDGLEAIRYTYAYRDPDNPIRMVTTLSHGRDHYCHEYTVDISTEAYDDHDNEVDVREEDRTAIKEGLQALMRWIYRALEESYTYSESDPVVADNIIANEYAFLASGARCTLGGN